MTKEEKNSNSAESTQEKAITTKKTKTKVQEKVQEKTKSSQKETQEKDPSQKKKSPPASKKKTEKTKQEKSKKEATSSKETKNSDKKEKEKETRNTETFAIIQSGGKQYKVSEGTILDLEYIEIEPKKKIEFKEVLLVHSKTETKIGQPFLKDTKVTASVLNQIKSPKIIVFKFKRKTGYKKTQGHRQLMTTVKIEKI